MEDGEKNNDDAKTLESKVFFRYTKQPAIEESLAAATRSFVSKTINYSQ